METELDLSWSYSNCTLKNFRVCGISKPFVVPSANVEQGFVVNISACDVAEVCTRLKKRSFIKRITSIHEFSIPVIVIGELPTTETITDVTSQISACAECYTFLIDEDLEDNFKATFSYQYQYDEISDGTIVISGENEFSAPNYEIDSEGGVSLYWDYDENLGTFDVDMIADDEVSNESVVFSQTELSRDFAAGDLVTLDGCCSFAIPRSIFVSHNLTNLKPLADFLKRNNKTLSGAAFPIQYSDKQGNWSGMIHLTGISPETDNNSLWDIVFEWKCADTQGSLIYKSNFWSFSVSIRNKDLVTQKTRTIRFIAPFDLEASCEPERGFIGLDFTYDLITTLLNPTGARKAIFYDESNLVNSSPLFSKDPFLRFSLSTGFIKSSQLKMQSLDEKQKFVDNIANF